MMSTPGFPMMDAALNGVSIDSLTVYIAQSDSQIERFIVTTDQGAWAMLSIKEAVLSATSYCAVLAYRSPCPPHTTSLPGNSQYFIQR
ncbi:MAG: hypothetical protein U1E36_06000 [Rickettsiales bacterium]